MTKNPEFTLLPDPKVSTAFYQVLYAALSHGSRLERGVVPTSTEPFQRELDRACAAYARAEVA